jgi:hypothetical protein
MNGLLRLRIEHASMRKLLLSRKFSLFAMTDP